MQATKYLPPEYRSYKSLNLSGSRTILWLNLAAILLLFFFGWLFSYLVTKLSPFNSFQKGIFGFFRSNTLINIVAILLTILIMLVLHELTHGIFFWLFTHEPPRFSLKAGYAFAAAPEWYLPRLQYILVGISPFLIITTAAMVLIRFVSPSLMIFMLLIATFNAAGSIGDLIVVAWILRQPMKILIKDEGDIFYTFSLITPSPPYEL
jgi:hypothetical protein